MKILEVVPFSAGVCGVWARAREEAIRLSRLGHEVRVFSSNFTKGNDEIAAAEDAIEGVKIRRFSAAQPGKGTLKLLPGGESYMFWNFIDEAVEFAPDAIICHNYRQFHTDMSLRVAQKLRACGKNCRVLLVTHAPFPEEDVTRTFWGHAAAWFYDYFVGRFTINRFDKILAISHWEVPYLIQCGADRERIVYIPNGIPEEFFGGAKVKERNVILFLGRVAPKKKLETLISAVPRLKDKRVVVEIVGPREEEYYARLKELVTKLGVEKRVKFLEPIFDVKEKVKKIKSSKMYVLPSRVEGMPQSLIEAMACGRIVIGSDSIAIRDLIQDGKTGYLFEFDNPKSLAEKIDLALAGKNIKIVTDARKFVEQFRWKNVMKKIEGVIGEFFSA